MIFSLPRGPWTKLLTDFPKNFNEICILNYKQQVSEGSTKHHVLGYRMFKAAKVKNILLHTMNNANVIIKANVSASMKTSTYKCYFVINSNIVIEKSECSCVGGVQGRCKHIFALLYQMLDYIREEKQYADLEDAKSEGILASQEKTWGKGSEKKAVVKQFSEFNFTKPDPCKKNKNNMTLIENRRLEEQKHQQNKLQKETVKYFCERLVRNNFEMYSLVLKHNHFQPYLIESSTIDPESIPNILPRGILWLKEYSDMILCTDLPNIELINYVSVSLEEAQAIEKETRSQSLCGKWYDERQKRITSTKFFDIVRRRTPVTQQLISRIWPQHTIQSALLKYGTENEKKAIEKYEQLFQHYTVYKCGLVINPGVPCLATSPDGLVFNSTLNEYHLLEIKTLVKGGLFQKLNVLNCIKNGLAPFLKIQDGHTIILDENHTFYYQIQGQMALTGLHKCDLLVDSGNDLFIQTVCFNKELWIHECLPKLVAFYFNYMKMSNHMY